MTNPKLVPAARVQAPGGLAQLMEQLGRASDLRGLIGREQLRPADGAVESAFSGELMERVALAICEENISAGNAEPPRFPDVAVALGKAGCNAEMFLQISQHPDYQAIFERTYYHYILRPRLPAIIMRLGMLALAGDVAAAGRVLQERDRIVGSQDAMLEAANRGSDEAVYGKARDLLRDLETLLEKTKAPRVMSTEQKEARDKVSVRHEPDSETGQVNHGRLHTDATPRRFRGRDRAPPTPRTPGPEEGGGDEAGA